MKDKIGITLRDALKLPVLEKAEVIAGENNLSNLIKSVNIMGVPDIDNWVKESQLLITAFYSVRNDLTAQLNLIEKLSNLNLAGLALKPGRFIKEIPEAVIQKAKQNNFPLIKLPPEAVFSDIVTKLDKEIMNIQAIKIDKIIDTHELFMDIVLSEHGIPEIADTLSKIIDSSVIIINEDLQIIAKNIKTDLNINKIIAYNSLGDFYFLKNKFITNKNNENNRFNKTVVKINSKTFRKYSIPIRGKIENFGWIIVFRQQEYISKLEKNIIEQAAHISAIILLNDKNIFSVEKNYQNQFINSLLSGIITSKNKIEEKAKHFNWPYNKNYLIIVLCLEKSDTIQAFQNKHLLNNIIMLMSNYINSDNIKIGDIENKLIFICFFDKEEDKDKSVNTLIRTINSIIPRYYKKYYLGASSSYSKINNIKAAFKEAKMTAKIAASMYNENSYKNNDILFYDELGINKLFCQIDKKQLLNFIDNYLNNLIEYDKDNNKYLQTLKYYFKCNGNLKCVEAKSNLHYNTIKYRIKKIQEICDIDLNNSEQRLNLEIAIHLHSFINSF